MWRVWPKHVQILPSECLLWYGVSCCEELVLVISKGSPYRLLFARAEIPLQRLFKRDVRTKKYHQHKRNNVSDLRARRIARYPFEVFL